MIPRCKQEQYTDQCIVNQRSLVADQIRLLQVRDLAMEIKKQIMEEVQRDWDEEGHAALVVKCTGSTVSRTPYLASMTASRTPYLASMHTMAPRVVKITSCVMRM